MISSLSRMSLRPARRLLALPALLLSVYGLTAPARADTVIDGTNDFIPTFTGTHDPSLDVVSFSASFDGSDFHLSALENGPIAAFASGQFVIGINKGVGASNFSNIGHPGVTFDFVFTLTSAGVKGGTVLNPASIIANISGNGFTVDLPLSSVPSSVGAPPGAYGFNLWPRDTTQIATAQIADFAPDNSDIGIPEPVSVSLLGSGLVGLMLMRRRSRTA